MSEPTASTQALRLVVVMRHGEARSSSATGDHGRALTAAGRAEAGAAGLWLREQGVVPDVVVVSDATRTRQTWQAVEEAGVTAGDVRFDSAVYNGAVEDILEVVHTLPEEARVVLVVGHAPAIPGVATAVAAHCTAPRGWPPATVGVIAHPGEWETFGDDSSALVACRVGAGA